jgi:hypothetical protein
MHQAIHSQNNRLNTYNAIGWYNFFATTKFNPKLSFHTEFQYRRNKYLLDEQQNLFRIGINYHQGSNLLWRVGYAFIETYPYGDIPINGFGRNFSEHRIYQMIQLNNKHGEFNINHRFILEQRFIGRYMSATAVSEDEYPIFNRMRYMCRIQKPIMKNKNQDKFLYLAFYDEIFIGFGKNVNVNVFDQNRIGLLIGYKFNNSIRAEAGYLNQILQYGRQINNQNIFQYNSGIILNLNLDINLINT